jgi:hypothetical protein
MWIFEVAMKMWMRLRSACLYCLRDRFDGFEVAIGCDRETGLDDVDTQARELVGDLELLGDVERNAGRLLAVSQGRVEDSYRVHLIHLRCLFSGIEKPPGRVARRVESASTYVGSRLHKEEAQVCGGRFLTHTSIQYDDSGGQGQTMNRHRASNA